MGSSQYKHLIPVLEEGGYDVIDIQKIWELKIAYAEKEDQFRKMISKCDILYNLYSGNSFWAKASYVKELGKKVITHWIGTDALDAIEGRLGYLGHSFIDHNFSCYEPIQKELMTIGVETTVLPIIPFNMNMKIGPLPNEHAVLIYMPENRLEHYGYKECCSLFKKFPTLPFHLVGNDNKELFEEYKNVCVHGWLTLEEMDKLYERITILVRYIKHDGLSMSVIEALAKGKKVIWNYSYTGVNSVNSEEALCRELGRIISEKPKINKKICEYISQELSRERFMSEFNRVIEEIYK